MDALQAFKADPSSHQAQEELFLVYRGFLHHTAQKFAGYDNAVDVDDLVQEGFAALLKAATTYDSSKGNFLKWLQWAVQRAYLEALGAHTEECEDGVRRPCIPPRAVSLQTPLSDDGEAVLEDTIVDESAVSPEDQAVSSCVRSVLAEGMEALTDIQRAVIERHMLHGETMHKVAHALGVSYWSVQNEKVAALRALRKTPCIRALSVRDLDYYMPRSVSTFTRTRTSATEALAFKRMGGG